MRKEYKQVILVRQDLKLPKGKLAVQAAHASVEAMVISKTSVVDKWRHTGAKKVALKVADLEELKELHKKLKKAGIATALITDAGKTTIAPGTTTCLGVGPDEEEKIDEITGSLRMI